MRTDPKQSDENREEAGLEEALIPLHRGRGADCWRKGK